MDGSHSRSSFPANRMFPLHLGRLLTKAQRQAMKKLHNRKVRYTAAHARTLSDAWALGIGEPKRL